MSTTHLKVKVKSLAAESKIIRKEEGKFKRMSKWEFPHISDEEDALYRQQAEAHRTTWISLQNHRRFDVRSEQRAAYLAYAFLRGKTYASVEPGCWSWPDWERVAEIIIKFGPPIKLNQNGIEPTFRRGHMLQHVIRTMEVWRGDYVSNNRGKFVISEQKKAA